jgi:hypothetical protein
MRRYLTQIGCVLRPGSVNTTTPKPNTRANDSSWSPT